MLFPPRKYCAQVFFRHVPSPECRTINYIKLLPGFSAMLQLKDVKICVVGLGYVGLPLAVEFSKHFSVIGFDIDERKIALLKQHIDPANEVSAEELKKIRITYTTDPQMLKQANFIIVAVPTPITKSKKPDLSYVESSSKIVGQHLQKGSIVVFESTVYPGVTEDICVPIIEKESGLKCGKDWKIGYSPERINPGDKQHYITKVVKIVSGMDAESLDIIAQVYGKVVEPGVYKASSIKVAEAAKVIENTQRDLNIALMNELALIFARMGISTKEVIDAASTKWNFHRYLPGLVGGHCISVDPHYLLYRAEELGYHPKVILAGREVNDYMPKYVAEMIVKELGDAAKSLKEAKVYVMGLTFKENVKDMRNSKIRHTITELKEYGATVIGYDPLLSAAEVEGKFEVPNVPLEQLKEKVDCIIIAKKHAQFAKLTFSDLKQHMNSKPILVDLAYLFDRTSAEKEGFVWRGL